MKNIFKIAFVLCLMVLMINPVVAQNKKDEKKAAQAAVLKQLLESKAFTFQANFIYPSQSNVVYPVFNGQPLNGQRYLTPGYDMRVAKDTVAAYLPFIGVAYSGAGYNNPDENGIKFTSTDFIYTYQLKKNGMFYVLIKPKGIRNATQISMTVSPNGYADLVILSINRESMRFSGVIKEIIK